MRKLENNNDNEWLILFASLNSLYKAEGVFDV